MQTLARRYETAAAATSRARVASSDFGLAMVNGSWSIQSATFVPTTDHKHEPPRRSTVIPT